VLLFTYVRAALVCRGAFSCSGFFLPLFANLLNLLRKKFTAGDFDHDNQLSPRENRFNITVEKNLERVRSFGDGALF
jgi:hypothetical protein